VVVVVVEVVVVVVVVVGKLPIKGGKHLFMKEEREKV